MTLRQGSEVQSHRDRGHKHLGHVLAVIKAEQDTYFIRKVNTNSQKLGYQKRGRTVYGPNYIEEDTPIADGCCRCEHNSVGPEIAIDQNQIVLDRNKGSETVAKEMHSLVLRVLSHGRP